MAGDEAPTLHEDIQVELAKLRLKTQTDQLESQNRIERNTFWTMIAVASHAGIGVLSTVPHAAALAALALPATVFLVWRR